MPENNPEGYNKRGSLKQVNATLLAQTDVLRDTQQSILSTNNLLTKSLQGQLKVASMQRLKGLEEKREGGRFAAAAGGLKAAGGAVGGAASRAGSGIQNMLGQIGSFLTPAALAALPGILAGTLLRRGIPALAVGYFSDEIADFLLGPDAEKEMRDQVSRAIKFGAAGSLLGKRFAVIGAAAGFLIDDEVAAKITNLGKTIGNMIGVDVTNIENIKDLLASIGGFLRGTLKDGLDGINMLLNGQILEFFGAGEGENKVFGTLTTLALLGTFLVGPGATLRAALALGGIGLWTSKKVFNALKGLAGLGSSIVASAGADMIPGGPSTRPGKTSAPRSTSKGILSMGKNGLMVAAGVLGPAGLLLAAGGVIAGVAAVALRDSAIQDEIRRTSVAGLDLTEEQAAARIGFDAPDVMGTEMGEMAPVGPGGLTPTEQRLRLADIYLDGYEAVPTTMRNTFLGYSTGERQSARQAEIEAEKYLRMLKRPEFDKVNPPTPTGAAIKEEAEQSSMSGNNVSGAINAIDASNNTVNTVNNNSSQAYSMWQSGASKQDVYEAWVEGNRSSPR